MSNAFFSMLDKSLPVFCHMSHVSLWQLIVMTEKKKRTPSPFSSPKSAVDIEVLTKMFHPLRSTKTNGL